ncbi:hypothetical protein N0B44_34155 [Roseibacterium beibuensis]|uniref:DUF6894 family protein n=1 Tax=[Roseibacterium] beibuensis TaxID=1193142 RepID=UPI00217EA19D|nr:hypothetical protein [Roseibacterium beibuensis]MCS6627949.1 hypothetical protein [Roseibacterium beibuensis]
MPRFYFDISDGIDVADVRDDEGIELEGLNAARIEAVRLSGELLKSYPDRFWSVGQWNCTVRDDKGLVLFVLHFYAQEAAAVGRSISN